MHNGILLSHKKDKTTAICDNRLSEINQMDKSKNYMISLICGIKSKQTKNSKPTNKNKLKDTDNRWGVTRGEGE